ncbi:MAG TPA: hypothetical protein VE078_09495, partial [Thermoanaerobaculia bacterium]|nr:hypothetical protein [Thermoanaerobaculia bacterium]
AGTGSGSLDPAEVKVSGTVKTPSGGAEPIAFSGTQGLFRVPDVAGRHAVVVKVETSQKLGRAEARVEYEAVPPDAAELKSSREDLAFGNALGPEQPQVEESFKVYADFPEGARPRPVKVAVTLSSPVGVAELARRDGGVLRTNGTAAYPLPPEGLELVLRIKMDPRRPLTAQVGRKHDGEIRIFSGEAGELTIPFHLEVRIPRFELKGKRDAFALWWDPRRPRTVGLGRLHTDLSKESTFSVVLPEAIHAPNQGPKMADLALRVGDRTPEPERLEEGKLRYGPLDLPPGEDVPLELVVTPAPETGWDKLPASGQPFEIRLVSSLGMEAVAKPTFWNVGGPAADLPLLGTLSRHGRHAATALVVFLGLLVLTLLTLRRARVVKRFWSFRPGRLLTLGSGPIQIGDVGPGGSVALLLPNSGSELDDRTLGRVFPDGRRQRVEDSSGWLVLKEKQLTSPARLAPGDVLAVADPRDADRINKLWEIEYIDFIPGEGGEIEVMVSPAPWTLPRLLGRLALGLAFLFLLKLLLAWGQVAALAYRLPLVESFYVRVLLP